MQIDAPVAKEDGGSPSSSSGGAGVPATAAAAPSASGTAEFDPLPAELGRSLWEGASQQVVLNIEYMSGFTTRVRSSSHPASQPARRPARLCVCVLRACLWVAAVVWGGGGWPHSSSSSSSH